MIDISYCRHPKEKSYFAIMAVFAGIIWLILLIAIASFLGFIGIAIPAILFLMLIYWIIELFFRSLMFGNSVLINNEQYAELNLIAEKYTAELGLRKKPNMFLVNSNGVINAFAVRFLSKKYIILNSSLVDLFYRDGNLEDLSFTIGHELGHHAAGHTSTFKRIFLFPARILPLIGRAYSRSCELTADRIGCALVNNKPASKKALTQLAGGSFALSEKTDTTAFINQGDLIPPVVGFIHKIFSNYPYMTRRVIEIEYFEMQFAKVDADNFRRNNNKSEVDELLTTFSSGFNKLVDQTSKQFAVGDSKNHDGNKFCTQCGHKVSADDKFCIHCGNKFF